MMPSTIKNSRQPINKMTLERGFSLIEVLVSAFVLGVGLLGAGALMTRSIQANTSAIYRTQAVQLGYEIMDRIRANPEGNYAIAMGANPPGASDCANNGANCNTTDIRNFDLMEWKCGLGDYADNNNCQQLINTGALVGVESGLPGGDGSIEVGAPNGQGQRLYSITIQWIDTRDDQDALGDDALQRFTMETRI